MTIDICAERDRVGPPTTEEASYHITEIVPEIRGGLLENMQGKWWNLGDFTKSLSPTEIPIPTARTLCVRYIQMTSGLYLHEWAEKELEQDHVPAFRFLFDFTLGLTILEEIAFADLEIEGKAEEELVRQMSDQETFPFRMSPGDQASYFLNLRSRARKFAGFLEEDPTGIKILEASQADQLAGNNWSIQSQRYLLAGSETAILYYRELLPQAEMHFKPE